MKRLLSVMLFLVMVVSFAGTVCAGMDGDVQTVAIRLKKKTEPLARYLAREISERYFILAMSKEAIRSGFPLPKGVSPAFLKLGKGVVDGGKVASIFLEWVHNHPGCPRGMRFFLTARPAGDIVVFDIKCAMITRMRGARTIGILRVSSSFIFETFLDQFSPTITFMKQGVVFERVDENEFKLEPGNASRGYLNKKIGRMGIKIPSFSKRDEARMVWSGLEETVRNNGGVFTFDRADAWLELIEMKIMNDLRNAPSYMGYLYWIDGEPHFRCPPI